MTKTKSNLSSDLNIEKKQYFEPKEFKLLISIVAVGFLVRLFYIIEIQNTPFVLNLFSDSKIYNDWAWQLVTTGNWFGAEVFFMVPIYPYILGIIYLIFGHSIFLVQILQVIISTLNIFLIYLIARNISTKQVGYIAAVISSLYSIFVFYSGAILSETFQVFMLSILLFYISANFNKKDFNWLVFGLLLGISALFRANILIFFFGVLFWIYFNKKSLKTTFVKSALLFSFGVAIPILPVTINNYVAEKDFVLLTSNGGLNFYIGNGPNAQGVFVTPKQFDYFEDMSGRKFAEKNVGHKLSASQASSYWYGKTLKYMVEHPGKEAELLLKKVVLFFGSAENSQSAIMDKNYFENHYSKILKLPLFSFYFVSIFGMFGLIIGWKKKREFAIYYVFFATYVLGAILFFVNGRFRLGLTPLLIVFAAYGTNELLSLIYTKKYNYILKVSIVPLLFVIVYSFMNKPVFNNYDAYFHLGEIAYNNKDYNKAIENYQKSLFYNDGYLGYMNIGNALAMKKDFRNSIAAYQKAIARDPSVAKVHFNLGFAYTQSGNFDKAIQEYQTTLQLDPKFIEAYRNMGIILYITEKYQNALNYYNKFLSLSKDAELNKSVKYDIQQIKQKIVEKNKNGKKK